MTELLLGLVATMIAGNMAFLKWLMTRSDAAVKDRDETNGVLIKQLTRAVDTFQDFEKDEDEIHAKILQAVRGIVDTQGLIVDTQGLIVRLIKDGAAAG